MSFASPKFHRKKELEKSLIYWKSELEKSKKQVEFVKKSIVDIQKELEKMEVAN